MKPSAHLQASRIGRTGPCNLCTSLSSARKDYWNQSLFGSEHFVAIPSLGSLVEGWLLIVPNDHYLSSALLPDRLRRELASFKEHVRHVVHQHYGTAQIFEHGPAEVCRHTGCGVDHAHVHVVPFAEDLSIGAKQFLPDGVEFRPGSLEDCRAAAVSGLDYLYLERPTGEKMVAIHEQFGSQTFRKAMAHMLGTPDEYDWHDHPQMPRIAATIARLGSSEVEARADSRLARLIPV